MSLSHRLGGLTTREAITDTIYRATVAFDNNDPVLLTSALTQDIVFELRGKPIVGLDNVKSSIFKHVGNMVTSHFVTNIRIDVADDGDGAAANTASVFALALAYHFPAGQGFDPDQKRWVAGVQYFVDMVKDEGEGVWKAKKWVIKTLWGEGDVSIMQF